MTEIAVWRGWGLGVAGFWHHGILCPDRTVIHYTTTSGVSVLKDKEHACILRTSLETFKAGADKVYEVKHEAEHNSHTPGEIVIRAESRIGERGYDLFINSCESFTKWCVSGNPTSRQIAAHAGSAAEGAKTDGLWGACTAVAASAWMSSVLNCYNGKMVPRPDL